MALNSGWLLLNNSAKKVEFEHWELDIDHTLEMEIDYLSGDTRSSTNTQSIKRIIRCYDLWFTAQADAEEFIDYILARNDGSPWKLEIQTHSDGTKFKFDGTHDDITVYCTRLHKMQKVARGDQDFFKVGQIEFAEAA